MSTDYDPVRRLVELGLTTLAQALYYGTEVTIELKGGGTYCIYKPRAVVNVSPEGQVLLGDPAGVQLALNPGRIRVSSGVAQLPSHRGIVWERLRESF
jgi:hypothetical protein